MLITVIPLNHLWENMCVIPGTHWKRIIPILIVMELSPVKCQSRKLLPVKSVIHISMLYCRIYLVDGAHILTSCEPAGTFKLLLNYEIFPWKHGKTYFLNHSYQYNLTRQEEWVERTPRGASAFSRLVRRDGVSRGVRIHQPVPDPEFLSTAQTSKNNGWLQNSPELLRLQNICSLLLFCPSVFMWQDKWARFDIAGGEKGSLKGAATGRMEEWERSDLTTEQACSL